jgi:Uma2 family endonuclease
MSEPALKLENVYQEERRRELIDGKIVYMAPPDWEHSQVTLNMSVMFKNFLKGKNCDVAPDGAYLYLTKTERYQPDMMVICDKNKIDKKGVHGAPDLVVEVLSLSTQRYDKGHKKNIYEKAGVLEYWIVDKKNRTIEVYLLKDGRLEMDNVYIDDLSSEVMYDELSDERKAELKTEVSPSMFPDFVLPVKDVFEGLD